MPESKGVSSGSVELATSCLRDVQRGSSRGKAPLTFENVQAYPTQFIDVRVVYFCQEPDLGWCHGVVVG